MKKSNIILLSSIMGIVLVLSVAIAVILAPNKKNEDKQVAAVEKEKKPEKPKEEPEVKPVEEEPAPEVTPEENQQEPPKQEQPQTPEVTTPKVEAIPGQSRDPNRKVVVIDPGHQLHGDSTLEQNAPGSSVMKARVTQGTTGVATRVPEYVLNLAISLQLKTELENRGYTVYMTRSTHEVNISNRERAEYATTVKADIAVRIHANGSTNAAVNGAEAIIPSASNPYVGNLANASQRLGQCILDAYCAATGFQKRTVYANDTMTGINWSTVPVTILEMGYMSNAEEDRKMQDVTMQNNMVQGIANGIDAYFGIQ